jgi:two-component system NtrC family sensor kinase
MNDKAAILAVDDTSESLALPVNTLTPAGYDARPVDNGELALAAVAANPPDSILLDVNTPGVDELEACRRLKAIKAARGNPPDLIISEIPMPGMDSYPFHCELRRWRDGQ